MATRSEMGKVKTSMAFERVTGGMDGQVVVPLKTGLIVRRKPRYGYPKNPDVQSGAARLSAANAAWNTLNASQADAWRRYASGVILHDSTSGRAYNPAAKNAFVGLASKFMQVNPGRAVPLEPPMKGFNGDWIVLSALAGAGEVVFTASKPNSPDAATELLAQPLKNVRCKPGNFYKSQGFVEFTASSLSATVALAPGCWALAYRFVRPSTGQQTDWTPIGVVEVE